MGSSFHNNAPQMKKTLKIICIFSTACTEKESACFQDLPEVPEEEVFLLGETVEVKDCPVVDEATKLSFCVDCVPLA